eukprot:4291538-Alexandrium_andersonii.AAC.1
MCIRDSSSCTACRWAYVTAGGRVGAGASEEAATSANVACPAARRSTSICCWTYRWREGLRGAASFTAARRARAASLTSSSKARPVASMVSQWGVGVVR